jgi:hypothetical protein
MNPESEKKLEYEKPVAMPLGEPAKGSGQCNAGSGVGLVGGSGCTTGSTANINCGTGNIAVHSCAIGIQTGSVCQGGSQPFKSGSCAPGTVPLGICQGGSMPNY